MRTLIHTNCRFIKQKNLRVTNESDDKRKSLGALEQGAYVALPIWMEFMKAYIGGRPDKDDPPDFEAPGNIVFLAVDKTNGAVLPSDMPGSIHEAFISGTQPGAGGFAR